MSFRDIARTAFASGMSATAEEAVYHSLVAGEVKLSPSVNGGVRIQPGVDRLGDGGAFYRFAVATLRADVVTPRSGDWIEANGKRWRVEQLDDEGTSDVLLMLRVEPML